MLGKIMAYLTGSVTLCIILLMWFLAISAFFVWLFSQNSVYVN
jgi:ABC-type Na+ efflux pump permease subunit